MSARLSELESWREGMTAWQVAMDKQSKMMVAQTATIESMIVIFERIEAALWLFVKLGNGLKWILSLGAVITAAWLGYKKIGN